MAFFAFAFGEPIRYPYYFLKTLGKDKKPMGLFFGHLRYNFFIVFYPIGAFCDLMTTYYAGQVIREKDLYSYHLPNKYNIAFNMPFFCEFMVPSVYALAFPANYLMLLATRKKYYKGLEDDREKARTILE